MTEKQHWADLTAENLIKINNKDKYVCAAGITPSGTVHIGNFREIITVDLVKRALENKGKKVRFIYSWDNFDVFRKVPIDAPKKELLEKYLRVPITEVPDTYDGKHKSYAEHNQKEVEETIPLVNIHPEFLYQTDKYKKCEYAEEIKKALDNKNEIKKILDKYRAKERGEEWWPVSIFCSKCRKDTTRVLEWDKKYKLAYECNCGFKESFDFRKKGIAKLPWRIDWPMRWNYEGVDFEPGGKEHSTLGGSRTTAEEIFNLLYNKNPPLYLKYDFITIKGRGGKISKSKGNLVSLKDALEVYEPEVLRFLFTSTRPDTEFSISFDLDVIKIYEDFDRCERIYFKKEEISDEKLEREKRIYELSCIKIPKKTPCQFSFRHLTNIIQVNNFNIEKIIAHYSPESKKDLEKLKKRAVCAINWLKKYAPEEFKFEIQVKPSIRLNNQQKEIISSLVSLLKKKKFNEESLHKEIYVVIQELSLSSQEFFQLVYKVMINKEKGPKLSTLITSMGQEKTAKLLSKCLKE